VFAGLGVPPGARLIVGAPGAMAGAAGRRGIVGTGAPGAAGEPAGRSGTVGAGATGRGLAATAGFGAATGVTELASGAVFGVTATGVTALARGTVLGAMTTGVTALASGTVFGGVTTGTAALGTTIGFGGTIGLGGAIGMEGFGIGGVFSLMRGFRGKCPDKLAKLLWAVKPPA